MNNPPEAHGCPCGQACPRMVEAGDARAPGDASRGTGLNRGNAGVSRRLGLWATAALAWLVPAFGAGAQDLVWELETWEVPFDYSSPSRLVRYEPLERATRKWRICASYPTSRIRTG